MCLYHELKPNSCCLYFEGWPCRHKYKPNDGWHSYIVQFLVSTLYNGQCHQSHYQIHTMMYFGPGRKCHHSHTYNTISSLTSKVCASSSIILCINGWPASKWKTPLVGRFRSWGRGSYLLIYLFCGFRIHAEMIADFLIIHYTWLLNTNRQSYNVL